MVTITNTNPLTMATTVRMGAAGVVVGVRSWFMTRAAVVDHAAIVATRVAPAVRAMSATPAARVK